MGMTDWVDLVAPRQGGSPTSRDHSLDPDGWNVMVDMFFYRDPEEVEKQQAEEAAAKNAVAGDVEGAPAEWDISSAPQAGAINPALVSQDGGEHL
jgi:hypothetical protein